MQVAINKKGNYFHMVANGFILETRKESEAFKTSSNDIDELVTLLNESDPEGDWEKRELK